ncbi:hypothetical protein QL285_094807 [Trifolium repens]|nr:hypothetical protein QL285_094807 [Trifolium repens]
MPTHHYHQQQHQLHIEFNFFSPKINHKSTGKKNFGTLSLMVLLTCGLVVWAASPECHRIPPFSIESKSQIEGVSVILFLIFSHHKSTYRIWIFLVWISWHML